MASSVLCLAIIIFLSPPFSATAALLLPLSHLLSTTHYNTTHHLLKSTSARTATRFHRHRRQVSLPLVPGSDYTLSFSIDSQTISLYMDTGSDVVWIPCHPFECILCDGKYSPSSITHPGPLNITSSSATSVPCKSPACSAAHSSLPSSDLCAIAKCPLESIEISDCKSFSCPPFYYAYGDGSFVAKLHEASFSVPLSKPPLNLPKFTFGCAHEALGEPIGVAGFGRGLLSLPAQLARKSPEIGNYFSYCLVSHGFNATRVRRLSPLVLGRFEENRGSEKAKSLVIYRYTPMLDNPKHVYFYCVGLEAISVGRKRIPAPENLRGVDERGNGGMVVDSGTTFTMLPRMFYESVMGEFDKRVGERAVGVEEQTGLSRCYFAVDGTDNSLPSLLFHFGGNSTVAMPRRNYFYEFFDGEVNRKVGCLMMMDVGDEADSDGGPAGLLGNYQQQGFEVVYDLDQNRVGFARRKCASLWDSFN